MPPLLEQGMDAIQEVTLGYEAGQSYPGRFHSESYPSSNLEHLVQSIHIQIEAH